MIGIDLSERNQLNYSNIGAIVCHTPKTLHYVEANEAGSTEVDHRCELVSSIDELLEYFGDPYIDPTNYADLILVYKLVTNHNLVYVSSIDDMVSNEARELEEGNPFKITYNGYTEFMFVGENPTDNVVGYKIKSDIKFCQPFIRSLYVNGILNLYVDLFMCKRNQICDRSILARLNSNNLYKTLTYRFTASEIYDSTIINELSKDGLELKFIYNTDISENERSTTKLFIDELIKRKEVKVHYNSFNALFSEDSYTPDIFKVEYFTKDEQYWYTANGHRFGYNFDNLDYIESEYTRAIELFKTVKYEPHLLCLGSLKQSKNIYDMYEKDDGTPDPSIIRSTLDNLDSSMCFSIFHILLNTYTEDCNTYLFINMPNVTSSSALGLLEVENLPQNYNCDLYYGIVRDYTESSLRNAQLAMSYYQVASLSFFNMLNNASIYMSNSVVKLNISNNSIRLILSQDSANKLRDARCNSLVTFDTGSPSIYGNRSLSLLPNLRFSFVSRNFVRIRRLIHEYLETKKFCVINQFSIDSWVSYIKTKILDNFMTSVILKDYTINYTFDDKTVTFNVNLQFSKIATGIDLSFSI